MVRPLIFDGYFKINNITPGKYKLEIKYLGYQTKIIEGLVINANQTLTKNIKLKPMSEELEVVEVVHYKEELIDLDAGSTKNTITRDELEKMPLRSAGSIASATGGVVDGPGGFSVRGGRSNATAVFVDGIKVRGSYALPKAALEEVQVMLGGVPANYGDLMSGVISITTRSPSAKYHGNIDYMTSGFMIKDKSDPFYGKNQKNGYGDKVYGFDQFGYNLIEGSISGPLLTKTDSTGKKESLLSFFLSGNYTNTKSSTLNEGFYKLKKDVRDSLLDPSVYGPFRWSPTGNSLLYNADFLRKNDFESMRFQPNNGYAGYTAAGKIYLNTSPTINFMVGGQLSINESRSGGTSPLNFSNSGVFNNHTWRVFGRFNQEFVSDKPDSSLRVKNVRYGLMVDYTRNGSKWQSDRHRENIYNYGHVGTFETVRVKTFIDSSATTGVFEKHETVVPKDVMVYFTPSEENFDLASYTSHYYMLHDDELLDRDWLESNLTDLAVTGGGFFLGDNPLSSLSNIRGGRGLLNGSGPGGLYGIYSNIGGQYGSYGYSDAMQFRITGYRICRYCSSRCYHWV